MGIKGRIAITAALEFGTGSLTVRFTTATVAIEDIGPADGAEGTNYTANKAGAALFGIDLEALLASRHLLPTRRTLPSSGVVISPCGRRPRPPAAM